MDANNTSSILSTTAAQQSPLPVDWRHWTAAALPVVLLQVLFSMSLLELDQLNAPETVSSIGLNILTVGGLVLGWVRNFPRWSYNYAGLGVLLAAATLFVAVSGFSSVSKMLPIGGAWALFLTQLLPWLIGLVVAFLRTRSLRPLGQFWAGMWRDPTLLVLMFYQIPPLIWISQVVLFARLGRLSLIAIFSLAALTVILWGIGVRTYFRAGNTNEWILGVLLAGMLPDVPLLLLAAAEIPGLDPGSTFGLMLAYPFVLAFPGGLVALLKFTVRLIRK